ncbi:MAG: hypothetical protein K8J09_16305 [Planctomycetes bacterium]|nr:hypothetical protein [Planctomycetota bacterium]
MALSIRVPTVADAALIADALAASGDPGGGLRVAAMLQAGPARAPMLAAFDGRGRVLAVLAARGHDYLIRGEVRRVAAVDTAFMASHTRLGGVHSLAVDMFEVFREQHEATGGISLLLARARDADGWWLSRHAEFEPVGTGQVLRRHQARTLAVPQELVVQRWSEASQLSWPERWASTTCAPLRDRAWASGLLRDNPGLDLHVVARGGVVVGAIVYQRRQHECRLLDWASPAGDWPLAAALLQSLPVDDVPVVATMWNLTHWTAHALQEGGFVVDTRAGEPMLLARAGLGFLTRHFLAENQEEGELRVGEHVLPPFTCGEQIVTPPPPGTR